MQKPVYRFTIIHMTHVAIVGAGPAGATLAFLLASRGIQVSLIERRRDFAREFRGEVLLPNGVKALHSMGIHHVLEEIPTYVPQDFALYLNARKIFQLDIEPAWFRGAPPVAISQPAFLESIVGLANKTGCLDFRRGVSVKSLIHDGERVAGIVYQDESGQHTLNADLVIGYDGRYSLVRRFLDLPATVISTPMDIVWCKIPCPSEFKGARAYAGRGHLLIVYKTWDGNLQLGWVILKGHFKTLKDQGVEHWLQEMQQHVSIDLADHLAANISNLEKPFLLVSEPDRVDQSSRSGALVIGDAAHTMSPVGGQGINIAFRDCIVTANHLVPLLKSNIRHHKLDAELDAIERERLPELISAQQFQAQPPRLVLNTTWWAEPIRRFVGLALAHESVRARAAVRLRPMIFGTTEVDLKI